MRHKKNFTHALASILLAIATAAGCSGGGGTGSGGESKPTPAASRIDAISPSSARPGEQVTLTGVGFGAQNVAVEVGGADAHVVSATGTRVVFEVPSGLARGPTLVTASNPGERVGQIAFTVLEGILLPGDPNALAVDAVFSLPPTPVDDSEIQNGFIMTRLDVHLRPDATVADVNAALQRVGGGIVTMLARYPAMTIAIPVAADLGALTDAARTLRGSRGVLFADVGRVPAPKRLPPGEAGAVGSLDQLTHLLAARFPAAWNVSALATEGCASRKVTVLVADRFGGALIGDETNFVDEVPGFVDLGPEHSGTELHGYEVTTTLAALFDDANPTGANPFTDCLMVESFDVSRFTPFETLWLLPTMFPSDKFVLNFSLGFDDRCKHSPDLVDDACTPDQVDTLGLPLARAVAAADWKALTADRQADFLVAVAGGNEADKAGTAIYPGLGRAYFSSAITVAALPDPSFTFVQDGASWDPHAQPAPGGFPSMTATDDEAQALQLYLQLIGADALGPADNVLVVGSTTEPGTNGLVGESAFSDSAPDVMAVGETIPVLAASGLALADGTSFAAPQVGGLASYLWLLGRGIAAADPAFPDLSALPSAVTRQAILSNAQQAGLDTGAGLIDAYAATLSLDAATRPTPSSAPVRLKLLNVDTSGASAARFDEADVADFLAHLFAKDADGNFLLDANGDPLEPSAPDYGRYDLNGDGFTGGSRHARFDLDRVGSTQFGAAQYSAIAQDIDGDVAGFDESALTDVDILCYYAFSDLYEGDQALRHELFSQLPANHGCLRVDVTIDPASVTLTAGASRQFAATVTGASDPRVTWSVSGGGTIDTATGLFTAGSAAGTFTVRATSVADPSVFGEATVAVTAGQVFRSVLISSGRVAGQLEAFFVGTDSAIQQTISVPISDVAGFTSQLEAALAGVTEIGVFSVTFNEPLPAAMALSVSAPVGQIAIDGIACSSLALSAGDVRSNVTTLGGAGGLSIFGCLPDANIAVGDIPEGITVGLSNSNGRITAGNAGAVRFGCLPFACGQVQSSTVSVQAASIGFVSIDGSSNATITVAGPISAAAPQGTAVDIRNNTNLRIAETIAYGDIGSMFIDDNTFADSPRLSIGNEILARDAGTTNVGLVSIERNTGLRLSTIAMGSIAGNLAITGNTGFSDDDARAFAAARNVAGTVTISGNQP